MMGESELRHMYQAWQQGQDNYIYDWYRFVEWAATWNKSNPDAVMQVLQRYRWFERPQ